MAQISPLVERSKLSYDAEGDILYINFDKAQPADDSDITDEGVIIRLREGKIVGMTILNATKRIFIAG